MTLLELIHWESSSALVAPGNEISQGLAGKVFASVLYDICDIDDLGYDAAVIDGWMTPSDVPCHS